MSSSQGVNKGGGGSLLGNRRFVFRGKFLEERGGNKKADKEGGTSKKTLEVNSGKKKGRRNEVGSGCADRGQ